MKRQRQAFGNEAERILAKAVDKNTVCLFSIHLIFIAHRSFGSAVHFFVLFI